MRLLPAFAITLSCLAQTVEQPRRTVADPGVVTTRQAITAAGVPSVFNGRVLGVSWASSPDALWVLHESEVYKLDWKQNRVLARISHGGVPGNQGITTDSITGLPLVAYSHRAPGSAGQRARLGVIEGDVLRPVASNLGSFGPGAPAVASSVGPDGKRLAVVPLVWENKLAVIDISSGAVVGQAPTGIAPFAAAINRAGTVAYVTNLGGRPPRPNEAFASPAEKPSERVPVDARGVASTGTVTRVDLRSLQPTHTIAVGLHPTALKWDEPRGRLYVVNGNSDTVSVIDTASNQTLRTIALQPFAQKVRGIAPTALDVSRDGRSLFVACGGINAVAVLDAATGALRGMIPTGWYPNGIALNAAGTQLAVSSLMGAGSGWQGTPARRFAPAYRGSVAVLPLPGESQLASYTTAVAENNRLQLPGAAPRPDLAGPSATPAAVPAKSGAASLIEHVVFIIKENRTYDQVLGDMTKGNGDASLVMFGQPVTPNQHRLADQFVLLDNFYATGGNSADGHQWLTQANETDYCMWPGYQGRSYPFDGSDPMAYSSGGFLWDYALARGRTVKIYGEYAGTHRGSTGSDRVKMLRQWKSGAGFANQWHTRAPIAPLNKILAENYPAYSTAIPDVARAQIFLEDLKRFERAGRLPNLMMLQLPSNHTAGTSPGWSTPKAMVADNDLALGQIVEALTHTRFWPKMAIFVVEDDAQNGVDHVDGHRTAAFVASPYVRRGSIDSTFYSHQSMVKTIELMLGLPTMSIFDLIANDMRQSFVDTPDLRPFTAVTPAQDLFEQNPPLRSLSGAERRDARASSKMNWAEPDAAPTERVNRILWSAIKGRQTPYPPVQHSVFAPLSIDVDDDDR